MTTLRLHLILPGKTLVFLDTWVTPDPVGAISLALSVYRSRLQSKPGSRLRVKIVPPKH